MWRDSRYAWLLSHGKYAKVHKAALSGNELDEQTKDGVAEICQEELGQAMFSNLHAHAQIQVGARIVKEEIEKCFGQHLCASMPIAGRR